MTRLLSTLLVAGAFLGATEVDASKKAIAVIKASETTLGKANSGISGWVTFTQEGTDPFADVTVDYEIKGLPVGSTHGFHIHQNGDTLIKDSLDSLGLHFIPVCNGDPDSDVVVPGQSTTEPAASDNADCYKDSKHGPRDSEERHTGDMGNIVDVDGVASGSFVLGQKKISLTDKVKSIVGRAVVVHETEDSLEGTYGDAGGPIAMGVIGLAVTDDTNEALAMQQPLNTYATCEFLDYSDADTIFGFARLTRVMLDGKVIIRLKGSVTGLEAIDHSFHFHTYADMTVPAEQLGDIFGSKDVEIETLKGAGVDEATEFDIMFEGKQAGLDDIIGRSLTIHGGPETSDPTIARAVCGTAAVGDDFSAASASALSYFSALATAGVAFFMARN